MSIFALYLSFRRNSAMRKFGTLTYGHGTGAIYLIVTQIIGYIRPAPYIMQEAKLF